MKLFLAISIIFFGISASAQEPLRERMSGEFNNAGIVEFVTSVEKQTDYYFYYDIHDFDSIGINLSAKNEPVVEALRKVFEGTSISFAADEHKHIFLSKNKAIITGTVLQRDKEVAAGTPGAIKVDPAENVQHATLENKLYEVGIKGSVPAQSRVTLAGYVRDAKNSEPVTGASIQIEKLKIGVVTDEYGFYSITLPSGRYVLSIQSIGMFDTRRQILIHSNGKMDIELKGQVSMLRNVIVSAQKVSNVKGMQMGMQKIDIKTIKQVPVVFGEPDILRVVMSMPGVKTVGEASTGLNVRGGSADQNLILFNDATIYNPSHFFGMFSAFNPDVVKDVVLYKSSIPARYGGRLSSVLDISSREGNKKNMSGSLGVGPLTSRFTLEGPLDKGKTSFIIGARTTYANWLLKLLPDQYKNSSAGFYDLNLNISHEIDKNNSLYLTGYMSKDHFSLNNDTSYHYGNQNVSLKWKHIFNNRLNGLFTAGLDRYDYNISSESNAINAYKLNFNINQTYFRAHFNYYLSTSHTVDFGLNSVQYKLNPGMMSPQGKESLVTPDTVGADRAVESAIYLNDKYTINSKLSVEAGIRFSVFNYMGPKDINEYAPGPKTEESIINTIAYSKGKIIKTYGGPEYRASIRYALSENLSIKGGFNTQRQYIHMLSNTAAMAPTDTWKLSDPNIKPQYGSQVSLGLYRNFKSNTIETSFEIYYKNIKDYLDYKSGASLIMNHHIETDVINTKGRAYGAELLIKKLSGKLNGWISYTYSKIELKQDDPAAGELINKGQYYPSNYDKPHEVTMIANYRVNHRFSLSLNATYSTGRPITIPIGRYYYSNSYRTLYGDRNAERIPDYFRTDFSMNIDGNHRVNQKTHNSWTVGVYNLTGRKNPYSVYYVSENGAINGYKLSIFGSAIPFITFNIKF
jgi:hypothetical protein